MQNKLIEQGSKRMYETVPDFWNVRLCAWKKGPIWIQGSIKEMALVLLLACSISILCFAFASTLNEIPNDLSTQIL